MRLRWPHGATGRDPADSSSPTIYRQSSGRWPIPPLSSQAGTHNPLPSSSPLGAGRQPVDPGFYLLELNSATAGDAALLADPENLEELIEALRRLAADAKLAQDLASRGRERAAIQKSHRSPAIRSESVEFKVESHWLNRRSRSGRSNLRCTALAK